MRLIDADRLKTVIDMNMANNEIKAMFNLYVDIQPTVNEWIPVSERLPEEHRNVIVAIFCEQFDETFIDYEVACLSGDKWRSNDDGGFYEIRDMVIAWMPIPEYRE